MKYALVMYLKDNRKLKPLVYDLGSNRFCNTLTDESLTDSKAELSAIRSDFRNIGAGCHIIALPELNSEALDYVVGKWIPSDTLATVSVYEAAARVAEEIRRVKANIIRFGENLDLSKFSQRQSEFFKLLSRSAIDEIADRLA